MKTEQELRDLGIELLNRFSPDEVNKIITNHHYEEIASMLYGIMFFLAQDNILYAKTAAKTIFMLGYRAGQNTLAGKFDPEMWVVKDD